MPYADPKKQREYIDAYNKTPQGIERRLARAAARKAFISSSKDFPCTDCGVRYPSYVMQFDHLRDKKYTISRIRSQGIERIRSEIAKCEVVCANCHAERTATRKR